MAVHGYTGYTGIKKAAGTVSGGVSIGTQRNILCLENNPDSPDNNTYVNTINRGGYPSSAVAGRGSPTSQLHAMLKPYNSTTHTGWCDGALLNSFMGLGTDSNSDRFDLLYFQENLARQYNWARNSMLELSAAAVGGPVACNMRFPNRWGTDIASDPYACPYGTTLPSGEVIAAQPTFTDPGAPDPGEAADVINIQFVGMSHVKSFNLLMLRPQVPQYHFNGDRAPEDIISAQMSGLLTVEQEADATTTIDTTLAGGVSGSCNIIFCNDKTATTGRFKVELLLVRDRLIENPIPGIMSTVRTYSLFDLAAGGCPGTIVAF